MRHSNHSTAYAPNTVCKYTSLVLLLLTLIACGGGRATSSESNNTNSVGTNNTNDNTAPNSNPNYTFVTSVNHNDINIPIYKSVVLSSNTTLIDSLVDNNSFYIIGPGGKIATSITMTDNSATLTPTTNMDPATAYTLYVSGNILNSVTQKTESDLHITFTTSTGDTPPMFETWKSNMLIRGENAGLFIMDNSNSSGFLLDAFYYDGQYVFYQIGDFTGNHAHWDIYANKSGQNYENTYLTPNNFIIQGYWRFPHGIYEEWKRTGNAALVTKLQNIRDNPAFSDPETNGWASNWYSQKSSREIAYAIEANIFAEKAGIPREQARLDMYIDMALQHIDSWVTGNWITSNSDDQYVKPFMTGLTAAALIEYYEHMTEIGETNARVQAVIPAIKSIADWTWANMWVPDIGGTSPNFNDLGGSGFGAFRYMSKTVVGKGGPKPVPDLNLLIAPHYAWLYKQTCDNTYKQEADLIFAGGVKFAYLGKNKQFNQNYRKSFKYLQWRNEGDISCL